MKLTLIFLILIFPVITSAEKFIEFDFKVPPKSQQNRTTKPLCEFKDLKVPKDINVYATGAYTGRKLNFQIDQSGHAATQFDLASNSQEKPVALLLGAYEPTIWNIGWSPGTEIIAVLVSGYHKQVVSGLSRDVPLLISTYNNKGPCGYFYVGKGRNTSLNPKSRMLFKKPVDLVFLGDKTGNIVVGEPITSDTKLITSAEKTSESYRDATAPLAGYAGLEDAVAKVLNASANK